VVEQVAVRITPQVLTVAVVVVVQPLLLMAILMASPVALLARMALAAEAESEGLVDTGLTQEAEAVDPLGQDNTQITASMPLAVMEVQAY
jgi:hypothetical protein